MNQYQCHKNAIAKLKDISSSQSKYLIIHYSCESFYDREDGHTPRITTVAVRFLETGQTKSFSIQEAAEMKSINLQNIEENYNALENDMLICFYDFVKKNDSSYWIHWNMRDANYGFYALENRARVLGIEPFCITNDKKIDLARLLIDCYGRHYVDNPKLEKLVDLNNFSKLCFLSGKDEASAFENKQYIKLRNSTLRKVELLANILAAAINGTLKTNSKWKDKYGLNIQGVYEALKERWWFNVITFMIGILIGILLSPIPVK